MDIKYLINLMIKGTVSAETLWREEISKDRDWKNLLKFPILPLISIVALLTALLMLVFGYNIPFIGTIKPSISDVLFKAFGTVLIYTISIIVFGWFADYLASLMDGKKDLNRGVLMLFLISIPSLLGQILGTLPFAGPFLALGFGIYSLVLLYKAPSIFLDLPSENRTKQFLLFLAAGIVFSMLLSMSVGKFFTPKIAELENITKRIEVQTQKIENITKEEQTPEKQIGNFIDSMSKGDYGSAIIEDTQNETFTTPKENMLTQKQVDRFIALAQKIKIVQKEQSKALKEKYDEKEKQENFSISDIFNGIKDISNFATLEMKVVKTNGGNWTEFQWVRDQAREAFFTPSLNDTTKHNAKLLKDHREILKSIL